MSNLYKLSYISKNTISGDEDNLHRQIKSILKAAHKNNPAMGITGALLFSGGYFCQVIEGEEDNIESLFEIIQMDDRHADITVLNFEEASERSFAEWAMAFAGVDESQKFDLEGLKNSKGEIAMKQSGEHITQFLEDLIHKKQATLN